MKRFPQKKMTPRFDSAKPVWPKGRDKERNLTVGFRAQFESVGERTILKVAGSTLYRIYLNDQFVAHGPAGGPHGWYRMDEIDLTRTVGPGKNVLAIEIVGYNVNSFNLLDQPAFLQAEVVADGHVLVATGTAHPFESTILNERVQKVQRYSFQRPFSEAYRLKPGYDRWRSDLSVTLNRTRLAVQPRVNLLERRVPFSEFKVRKPIQIVSKGRLHDVPVAKLWKDRSLTDIGAQLGGYLESDLETIPSIDLQKIGNMTNESVGQTYRSSQAVTLDTHEYQILDLGTNLTGFIGATIACKQRTKLYITFDEILTHGDVDFKRLDCVNIITLDLEPGGYSFETFEPYTLRYLKLMATEGACKVTHVTLKEYVSLIPKTATFTSSDERLNRLFAAGVETFRQNAVGVFMDCPSRERAGWLCDSFFTARVAKDLTGDTLIEKNLFENYQLPESFAFLPDGMLPMCYPSDHYDGVFVPNWAMWFVVELEEYLDRSGDAQTVKALETRVMKLLDYFKRFRNSDGLLEKLEGWVFIEWSEANRFVQDVSYPTNMLYAEVLAASGRMYDRGDLISEAERIRDVIRNQSFDGEFFVDNAVRKNANLEVTRNRSEVCQYFAFFFHVATPESHPALWKTLIKDFGPHRKQTKIHEQVRPANAFVGNILRLELLSQAGLVQQLLDESLAYQLYMVDRTGTLWEHDGAYASCNHGFASHGGVRVLFRDILGLYSIDTIKKKVSLRFPDIKLESCEGSQPTPDGVVRLKWSRQSGKLAYQVRAPKGYQVNIIN